MKFRKREEGKKEGRKEGRKGLRLTRSLTHPSLFARSTQSGLQGRSSPASTLKQAWSDGRSELLYFVSFSFRRRRRRRRSFPPFYLRRDEGIPSFRPSFRLPRNSRNRTTTDDRIFLLLLRCDSDLHSLGVTAPAAAAGWEGEEGKALEKAEQNCKTPNLDYRVRNQSPFTFAVQQETDTCQNSGNDPQA